MSLAYLRKHIFQMSTVQSRNEEARALFTVAVKQAGDVFAEYTGTHVANQPKSCITIAMAKR